MCMVYYHAVDVVLGRKESVRLAWNSRCHLPKTMFGGAQGRKRKGSAKCRDFPLFKRMLAVKHVVYERHRLMFRMYEKFCDEAKLPKYWNDEDEDETTIAPAAATNEVVNDEGF